MGARAESHGGLVRLDEALLETWTSGNVAYDHLDDGLRRTAVHLGLLRESLDSGDADAALQRVDLLEESLRGLRTLVHRLEWLDELRAEPHRPGRVDLGALVERVLRHRSTDLEAAGAVVVVGDLPNVWAAASDLEIVFSELIDNAIRFRTDEPLAIRIHAEELAGREWASVTVTDTASGFSDEYMESIFEPGTVLLRDGVRPGGGVGLAACRLLAERNQGQIMLTSVPGKGTSVTVTLPTRRPATAA